MLKKMDGFYYERNSRVGHRLSRMKDLFTEKYLFQ